MDACEKGRASGDKCGRPQNVWFYGIFSCISRNDFENNGLFDSIYTIIFRRNGYDNGINKSFTCKLTKVSFLVRRPYNLVIVKVKDRECPSAHMRWIDWLLYTVLLNYSVDKLIHDQYTTIILQTCLENRGASSINSGIIIFTRPYALIVYFAVKIKFCSTDNFVWQWPKNKRI